MNAKGIVERPFAWAEHGYTHRGGGEDEGVLPASADDEEAASSMDGVTRHQHDADESHRRERG